MLQKVPLTPAGKAALKARLAHLKTERPRIVEAIKEARGHGDLKENAEYHAAKEQQGLIEAQIKALEAKLAHCHVIDITTIPNEGKVIFGATVTLTHIDQNSTVTYRIVGEEEANIKANTISVTSPIARAMIGKFEGEEITVTTPQGEVIYEIIDVEYI